MAEVVFTDAAIDDLRRLGPDVVPKVLKKVLILLDDPEAGRPLTSFRKLVVGHWHVVYRLADSSVEIGEIVRVGMRPDVEVYAEAASHVARVTDSHPGVQRLVEVIDRLGHLAGYAVAEYEPSSEPVPDWLAERLVHTAGVAPEKVAALNLEQAVDFWVATRCSPRTSPQLKP